MADSYLEYLVPRRSTGRELGLKILIIAGGVLAAIILFFVSPLLGMFSMIGYLGMFGVLFGAYKLVSMFNLEYEYIMTNGDLDVDKIINRNSRKRMISVKCSSFEAFGPYKEAEHKNKTYQTRLFACSGPGADNLWYAAFRHSKHGHTLLVFNATDKMLEQFKAHIPKQLAFEAFVKRKAQ